MSGMDLGLSPLLFFALLFCALAVLGVWIPFFLSRVRNELAQTNKMLAQIIASADRGEAAGSAAGGERGSAHRPLRPAAGRSEAPVCSFLQTGPLK